MTAMLVQVGKRHRDNARQIRGARLRPSIKQPAGPSDLVNRCGSITYTVCSCKALFFVSCVVMISCITVYCHCILLSPSAWIFYCPVTYQFSMFKKPKRFLGCVEDSYFLAFNHPLLCRPCHVTRSTPKWLTDTSCPMWLCSPAQPSEDGPFKPWPFPTTWKSAFPSVTNRCRRKKSDREVFVPPLSSARPL